MNPSQTPLNPLNPQNPREPPREPPGTLGPCLPGTPGTPGTPGPCQTRSASCHGGRRPAVHLSGRMLRGQPVRRNQRCGWSLSPEWKAADALDLTQGAIWDNLPRCQENSRREQSAIETLTPPCSHGTS